MNPDKTRLRRELAGLERDPARLAEASRRVCEALRQLRAVLPAGSGGVFLPLCDEPDLSPLLREWLREGLPLAAPCRDGKGRWHWRELTSLEDLEPGPLGTRQPRGPSRETAELAWILVPARAVDSQGNRLGRGAGIYDRLLAGAPGQKIGIVFGACVRSALPVDPHDIRLDAWVDENGYHAANPGAAPREFTE